MLGIQERSKCQQGWFFPRPLPPWLIDGHLLTMAARWPFLYTSAGLRILPALIRILVLLD